MQEKVSVIVPAYNIASWLPRCLDSILAQTYENLEVIVVNDGSTDDTARVLDAYAPKDSRVRVIHKENGGVTSARLRGVAEATGAWLGFIDGDDYIEPQMYARLLENAAACNADISHCGHRVIFPDGRVEMVHGTNTRWSHNNREGLRDLLDGGMVEASLCTKVYRRRLFEGLADWLDPSIKNNEDFLMNYYLFQKAESSCYEDICPYHYLLRRGSASYRELNRNMIFDPIRARQIILEAAPEDLKQDARIALMRNLLFAYAQLTVNRDRKYDSFRMEVRELLQQQRGYFALLSRRNWVLVNMICIAPWSFRLAYGAYVKLFQREEQH